MCSSTHFSTTVNRDIQNEIQVPGQTDQPSQFSPDQLIDIDNVYAKGMEGQTLILLIKLIGKNETLPITGHFCQVT